MNINQPQNLNKNHRMNNHMVKTSQKYKVFILLILFLSISLRLGLVRYNRQSNDAHDEVISYILKTGNLPEKTIAGNVINPNFSISLLPKFYKFRG